MSSSAKFPVSTGTVVNGPLNWTNYNYIVSDNAAYATATNSSTSVTKLTYYLVGYNYSFAIPTGATINGIVVTVEDYNYGGEQSSVWAAAYIRKADATFGTQNKKSSGAMPTSPTVENLGSSTDLWGETWTPAAINDSDFGVEIAFTVAKALAGGDICTAYVDYISITVYYTEAAGPANVKTVTGLVKASVKTVNGLVIASIKSIEGLT
jgi:hypothetical protein